MPLLLESKEKWMDAYLGILCYLFALKVNLRYVDVQSDFVLEMLIPSNYVVLFVCNDTCFAYCNKEVNSFDSCHLQFDLS